MFFCAELFIKKQKKREQASRAKGPASRRRSGRVPAGLRSVSPSPFLVSFSFAFLFLVYFLSPTPSLLSPHLYKYPHTPPLKHQIKSPLLPKPHTTAAALSAPPLTTAAAAPCPRRRRPTPPFAGAPRQGCPAPRLFFFLGSVFLINRSDSFLLFRFVFFPVLF